MTELKKWIPRIDEMKANQSVHKSKTCGRPGSEPNFRNVLKVQRDINDSSQKIMTSFCRHQRFEILLETNSVPKGFLFFETSKNPCALSKIKGTEANIKLAQILSLCLFKEIPLEEVLCPSICGTNFYLF